MLEKLTETALAELMSFGSATVHEANGGVGAADSGIKPIDPTMRVVGRALTVDLEPGDNWFLHVALMDAKPGDVLVVDAKKHTEAGPWGDVLTLAAQKRGVNGLLIDGAVRDTQAIIDASFPVFSRGISIHGTTKKQPGRINTPITFGTVEVSPGDIIVADRDGVCIVSASRQGDVLENARKREDKEHQMRESIAKGESTLSLLNLTDPR